MLLISWLRPPFLLLNTLLHFFHSDIHRHSALKPGISLFKTASFLIKPILKSSQGQTCFLLCKSSTARINYISSLLPNIDFQTLSFTQAQFQQSNSAPAQYCQHKLHSSTFVISLRRFPSTGPMAFLCSIKYISTGNYKGWMYTQRITRLSRSGDRNKWSHSRVYNSLLSALGNCNDIFKVP